jgi:hypothetical protein
MAKAHAHVMHMCYRFVMASASQTVPTRTVVLLRPAERKRLEKLAAAERVSSGEILRRSLRSYERPTSSAEDEAITALLAHMNTSLDEALASIRSARVAIRENLDKIDAMQQVHAQGRRSKRA